MDPKSKKTNIAERVKNLLASFIHSNDSAPCGELSQQTEYVVKGQAATEKHSSTVLAALPKSSTRHEAFIKRIEGFTTLTWFGKPYQLSPVRCARYGWENTARDLLQCVTCRRILCFSLPSPASDNYAKDVEELEKKLVQAHRENCSWRVNPCQGICLTELVSDRQSAIAQFISRLVSLSSVRELPPVDLSFLDQSMYVVDQLKQLLTESNVSGILGLKDASSSACVIALCGWSIHAGAHDFLSCTYCSRKVGIWKYVCKTDAKSDDVGKNGDDVNKNGDVVNKSCDDVDDEPRTKRRRLQSAIGDRFNPINEHKYWCAWLLAAHADEQKSNETASVKDNTLEQPIVAGWKWYLYTLLPDLNPDSVSTIHRLIGDVQTIPPYEGLRNIRHILGDWVSCEDLSVDLDKTLSPKKNYDGKATPTK